MEVHLQPDQLAIVEGMVASGRFGTVDEVIAESVRLLASTETLRAQIRVGVDQADSGKLLDHETVFGRLRGMISVEGDK
ncbi:MAG: type II toxin-antitoxin system ParD family antitoxin [Pirellulaceae bacterium]